MTVEAPGTNPTVTGAIRQASRMTGTSFQYLVATAQVESNLNPNASVSTSSARGLFQFIEQTWLATLKEQGPALGYGRIADIIARAPSGQYVVTDPRLNDRVMNMRVDATANAVMAGAFTKANAGKLAERLGRGATEGELYIAHFLGPTGAAKLIGLAESKPELPAAEIFPSGAKANRAIFFDAQGRPRSVAEVYRMLVGRYDVARGGPATTPATQTAASSASAPQTSAFAVDPALLAETYAAAARMSEPAAQIADAAPVFHSLFRNSARREAVAPVVSALWTAPAPTPDATSQAPVSPASNAPAGGTLDLFQDQAPDARALFRGRV